MYFYLIFFYRLIQSLSIYFYLYLIPAQNQFLAASVCKNTKIPLFFLGFVVVVFFFFSFND